MSDTIKMREPIRVELPEVFKTDPIVSMQTYTELVGGTHEYRKHQLAITKDTAYDICSYDCGGVTLGYKV